MRAALLMLTLLVSTSVFAEDEGRLLFEGRCVICHQLPEPDMLNSKQWRMVMTTMQKRMQQRDIPPLTEQEFEQVLSYLSEQAGQ